jgi:hypothetical protein
MLSYAPPQSRRPVDMMATWAAVCGVTAPLLSMLVCSGSLKVGLPEALFVAVFPVLGVSLAIASLRQGANVGLKDRARFALILNGLQVALGLLVNFLLPNMGKAREGANRIKCASNLRQIGQSLTIYANTYGGMLPPSFDELLIEGDITSEVFVCPSTTHDRATGPTTRQLLQRFNQPGFQSYVYAFPGGAPLSFVTADHVLVYEPLDNHPKKDGKPRGANALFGDGTVVTLSEPEARHLIRELESGHNPPRWPTTRPTGY